MHSPMKKVLEIVAGPNGSGKTTLSEYLIEAGKLPNLINADIIAKGLDASNKKGGEITAGKIMLNQINDSIIYGRSVSFETTLSGRHWIRIIKQAKEVGFEVNIYYLIVNNYEICLNRINERILRGGHSVPKDTVIRRYHRSKELLLSTYLNLVDNVFIFDNSNGNANLIATKNEDKGLEILKNDVYQDIFVNKKSYE